MENSWAKKSKLIREILIFPYDGMFQFVSRLNKYDFLLLLGILCLLVSPFLRWLYVLPNLGNVQGIDYPLWGTPHLDFSFRLNSAGMVVLVVAIAALAQASRNRYNHIHSLLFMISVWAAGLCFLYDVTLRQPRLLEQLYGKMYHFFVLGEFILRHLNPLFNLSLYLDTLPSQEKMLFSGERLLLGIRLLSEGWYMAMIGGALLHFGYAGKSGRKLLHQLCDMAFAAILPAAILMLAALPSLAADAILLKADQAQAAGDFVRAVGCLDKAEEINPNLKDSFSYIYRVGYMHCRMGRIDSPEALLYQAQVRKNAAHADSCFKQALKLVPHSWPIKTQYALFLLDRGRTHFNELHYDCAVADWERALQFDPSLFETHFLIAAALYEKGDFEGAVLQNRFFMSRAQGKELIAEACNNVGDCFQGRLQHDEARKMYLTSLTTSCVRNVRAVKALRGF